MKHSVTKIHLLLILFLAVGACLRFYNLNWGAPYYFHPDERNIAYAIGQMYFPYQLNPHFFAYGSLPIYSTYFIGLLTNFFTTCNFQFNNCAVTLPQSIVILRFFSATFSLALIPLLFKIGVMLHGRLVGLLAAFLATTSVGLMQYAHFGTFEMWLTFFTTFLFYLLLAHQIPLKAAYIIFIGIITGSLLAIKISSIIFLLPVFTVLLFQQKQRTYLQKLVSFLRQSMVFILTASLVYLLTNPFVIFDTKSLLSSLTYETNVATGKLLVFYTGGFHDSVPGLFTITNVYPFLLNPLIAFLFPLFFIYFIIIVSKEKKRTYSYLLFFFLLTFFSQVFLFVQWTRYMIPTLPFVYLICALCITHFFTQLRTRHKRGFQVYRIIFFGLLISTCVLWTTSYAMTVLTAQDTRIAAALWAKAHIKTDDTLFAEIYDLGITPFNPLFPAITLYNPYDFDSDPLSYQLFTQQLTEQDVRYIILPSQRVLKTRIQHATQFPNGYVFYHSLITQKKGYTKIYETPCDVFCRILYIGNPLLFEETTSVFDRPTVQIFMKQ